MAIAQDLLAQQRPTAHSIDSVNVNRWSPRSFLEKAIPEETLLSVFEAARFAPSAFNFQPWRFIVAASPEERERFYTFIGEFNLNWCKKAPVLFLIVSNTETEKGPFPSHAFDTGAAWGTLAHEAVRQGLVTHAMTGFDFAKAREALGIPESYAIQALVAIGYQGPSDALPEGLAEREVPSPRKPVQEVLFQGTFGQAF
ncbi:nitroreductase family protein [Cohnella fermenti]|uniref:Nitroreductase family protein n=1 Tax=Cohnella fermenti TaxID=2565925 RepID=A0A4S4C9W9_9BACL|nr:nitroreductase family protein [Cohnella fermenti]THF84201.1 nitroreductase family protein [Cohnella fermenti]